MLWKILLGVFHLMVRMKRLMWHLDPMLHWLLFKVLMAQEGDRVPAVEGQVCLVRWVSCGDRKEQISISENTHLLQCYPSQFIWRKAGKVTKRFSWICTTSLWATESSALRSARTYLESKETWPLLVKFYNMRQPWGSNGLRVVPIWLSPSSDDKETRVHFACFSPPGSRAAIVFPLADFFRVSLDGLSKCKRGTTRTLGSGISMKSLASYADALSVRHAFLFLSGSTRDETLWAFTWNAEKCETINMINTS